jgi:hypothetical protein
MVEHLITLLARATVVPAVNQIEVHPYFAQREVRALGAEHGILTQAWSPIGGITFYRDGQHSSTLEDPVIARLAKAHNKTPAQVMLRWHLQQSRSVIPKSTNPQRIAENIDVFDFELSTEDLAAIDALDTGLRGGPEPRGHHLGELRTPDSRGVIERNLHTTQSIDHKRTHDQADTQPARCSARRHPARRHMDRNPDRLLNAGQGASRTITHHTHTGTNRRHPCTIYGNPDAAGLLLTAWGELPLRRPEGSGGRQHRGARPHDQRADRLRRVPHQRRGAVPEQRRRDRRAQRP